MKAAQSLYEAGLCTYIRTDSVRMEDEAISEVKDYLKSKNFSLPKKPNIFKNKDSAQDAHECIRPTDISLEPKNSGIFDKDQKLVYEMIWKYAVASQMEPAVYSTLKVTAHVVNNPRYEVKASGKTLKSPGFYSILEIEDKSKIDIPNLSKDDLLKLFGNNPVKVEKKKTQPPPRFSQDKIIDELVNKNIGRPATYAELLTKITGRNYVERKGNVFHATELGIKITDELDKYFTFMKYNYTSLMETQLDEIAAGRLDYLKMLNDFYPPYKKELDKAYADRGTKFCDKCGSYLINRKSKDGSSFLGCSQYPRCNFTKNI
jgi:DNA topoisomerase-1